MASSKEFVEFVAGQLADAGNITYKKMFGEYGLYCNGLFFAVVCDDQLFIKPTQAGKEYPISQTEAPPYDGAKPYLLIEDLDDRDLLTGLTLVTCNALPPAPQKKPKKHTADKKNGRLPEPLIVPAAQTPKQNTASGKVDYKKAFKTLYQPKEEPEIVKVPEISFIMVNGKGDPNTCQEYKDALELLYGLSYTIKMAPKNGSCPDGYFEYVVPPLEGLWWTVDGSGIDDLFQFNKDNFHWTAMIRQPEFVTPVLFETARQALQRKKPHLEVSRAQFSTYEDGLCCQIMHRGPYDDEPESMKKIYRYLDEIGYEPDHGNTRRHHEIYLGDPRKTDPAKLRTVLRVPIRQKKGK